MATNSPAKKRPKLSLKFAKKEKPAPHMIEDDDPADYLDGQHDGHDFDSDHGAADMEPGECQDMPAPYCGLHNLGNTCYFNSVLQALRYTPGFCDGLKRLADVVLNMEMEKDPGASGDADCKPTKMTNGKNKKSIQLVMKLNQLFDMMMAKEDRFLCERSADHDMGVYPEAVLAVVRELNPMFQGYLQHDSQELLCCLLSQLQEASQMLLQVVKDEKQKRYKNSKLSLAAAKSGAPKINVADNTLKQDKTPEQNHISNGKSDKLNKVQSAQPSKSSLLANGLTNGAASNGIGNEDSCVIPKGSGEVVKSRKRTSSVRDSDPEGSDDDQTPKRKAKRRSRSLTPSSGTVVKSKAGKSPSEENCVNGHKSNGNSQTPLVNGNGNHTIGKSAKESKGNSGKKKRLGLGRMRVPFNQPTILSKFGFTKENGTPKNGINKELLCNGIENGSGEVKPTDHAVVNGKIGSETKLKTSNTAGQSNNNQSNNNSNETQPFVPNSPMKTSKKLHNSETLKSEHPTNNSKAAKAQPTNENKAGHLETDQSDDVECIGTVSNFEKYLQVVEKMFQGSLMLRTRCMECEAFTERREDFQDISVPVQKMNIETEGDDEDHVPEVRPNNLSLSWSLAEFACAERLTAENKYFCESCRHHNEAERTMLFGSLPPVLSFQLKRFCAFSGSLAFGGVSKVNDHIATPLSLCLNQWCTKQCRQRDQKYALYAVVMHSGVSSSSGHYICYVKIPNREGAIEDFDDEGEMDEVWGHFDDERATVLSDHEFGKILHPVNGSLTTATPYLLFYRKVEMT